MPRVIRTLTIGAAGLAAAWWLLHGPPKPERSASLPASTAGSPAHAGAIRSVRDGAVEPGALPAPQAVAEGASLAPPVSQHSGVAQAGGAGVTAEPIPMLDGIMLPGGMWNFHAMLERESRDSAWAEQKEREFATYFASKPELARNFGQPTVLCRSRSCEIQAIGYGPRAFDTWAAATQHLRDQPWRQEMLAGGIYTVERAPNEHAVVLILVRTPMLARDRASELRTVPTPQ